jgi:hypothetical protein
VGEAPGEFTMSWDDLSPEHKAIAVDGLAQMFGQANWQRELNRNPESLMLATLQVVRGPEGLEFHAWLDVLSQELHVTATWSAYQGRRVSGVALRHTHTPEQVHEMLRVLAHHLSWDIARESEKPTTIHCLSFRDAYEVLERRRT